MIPPETESMPETPPEKWAVLLIHGVGDTTPGDLLTAVGGAMLAAKPGLVLPAGHVVLTLPDGPTGVQLTFPVHTQTGTRGTRVVDLAEVHWADLTRAGLDTHQFVASVIRFVFGIRHLVRQAALIPGWLGWALNATLRPAVLLLQGPIYALFLYEAILCVAYLAFLPDAWDAPPLSRTAPPLVLAAVAAAVAAASVLLWWNLLRRGRGAVLLPSLLVVSLVALAFAVMRAAGVGDDWVATRLIPALNVPSNTTPGDWPLPVFVIDLVLDRLLFVLGFFLAAAGLVVALSHAFCKDPAAVRSGRTAWLATVLLVVLWEVLVRPIDLVAQWCYDKSRSKLGPEYQDPKYTFWYDELCLIGLGLAVTLVGLVVLYRQTRWALTHVGQTAAPGPAPRLIVSPGAQAAIALFGLILFPLAMIDGLGIRPLRVRPFPYGAVYAVYFIAVGVLLGGSTVFRNVVHLLADIIVHFAGPGADRLILGSPLTTLRYPVRWRIARRFRSVMNVLLAGKPTHVLIIADSQGTVIALEALRKKYWLNRLGSHPNVTLLTFGSPFTHLYAHYFPLLYAGLPGGRWKNLPAVLKTWVNVYRLDDYVGTEVEAPTAGPAAWCWPQNVPLEPGLWLRGHTRYWTQVVFQTPAVAAHLP